jgi:hypothetical protein
LIRWLLEGMLRLGGSQHRRRRSRGLRRGMRVRRLSMLKMLLLQSVKRLLGRSKTHRMRMRGHGSLRIHRGMSTEIGHGVHIPLQALQG